MTTFSPHLSRPAESQAGVGPEVLEAVAGNAHVRDREVMPFETSRRRFGLELAGGNVHVRQFVPFHQGDEGGRAEGFDGVQIEAEVAVPFARMEAVVLLSGAEGEADDAGGFGNRDRVDLERVREARLGHVLYITALVWPRLAFWGWYCPRNYCLWL